MARQDSETLWIAIGALGAMALGVALIPLRTLTSASNLAFGFLALTIVVAELGGRTAGLATAVVSALSLNFFLTEPYLEADHQPIRRHHRLCRAGRLRVDRRRLRAAPCAIVRDARPGA